MNKLSSKIAIVLALALVAGTQVYAEEAAQPEEMLSAEVTECQVVVKPESRISEILHKMPIISRLLSRPSKVDYVAEDVILTNYMMGTPDEIAIRKEVEQFEIVEDRLLENYMLAIVEPSAEESQIAEAISADDPLAEFKPVAFAADLEDECAFEEDKDYLQIDLLEEDLGF